MPVNACIQRASEGNWFASQTPWAAWLTSLFLAVSVFPLLLVLRISLAVIVLENVLGNRLTPLEQPSRYGHELFPFRFAMWAWIQHQGQHHRRLLANGLSGPQPLLSGWVMNSGQRAGDWLRNGHDLDRMMLNVLSGRACFHLSSNFSSRSSTSTELRPE